MHDLLPYEALEQLAQRLALRSSLGADERRAILALPAHLVHVRGHTDFVHAGEKVEFACLVQKGLVGRFAQLEDGRRQIISLHVPGDPVDLPSMLLSSAPSPLHAFCTSVVVKIPHTALRAAAAAWPALTDALWRETVVDANVVAQAVVSIGRRDARGRVAHLLCEMALRYRAIGALDGTSYPFPITQEQLADTLGLTSVHVNRTLRALREERLVVVGSHRVRILDWPGLQQLAEFDPAYLYLPDPAQPAELRARRAG